MGKAPYSTYRKAGNTYYISGQLPTRADDTMPDDVQGQTRAALAHILEIVEECGGSKSDVVKTTVFLADFNDFTAMNEAYTEFFSDPYPARSAFGVNGLAAGAKLEIEAVAVIE